MQPSDQNKQLEERLKQVRQRIAEAEQASQRTSGSARLLAVSKTRSAQEIRAAVELGQTAFGESYLQEALEKIDELRELPIEWHFIGRVQGNKTRAIAENFYWLHSLCSLKHAQRLSQQRLPELPPLKVCIQVNTSGEESKGGHAPEELADLMGEYAKLPGLDIRGLMTLPAPAESEQEKHRPFRFLRDLRDRLKSDKLPLETLSMGMSNDLEAAIAEGSTLVRVGTAIFGPRAPKTIHRD
jgi:pyridoxal phosphate enzyme (YggS family)